MNNLAMYHQSISFMISEVFKEMSGPSESPLLFAFSLMPLPRGSWKISRCPSGSGH